MPARKDEHTGISRPLDRHIKSQKVQKNEADEITHVTTMSLNSGVKEMKIDDDLPEVIVRPTPRNPSPKPAEQPKPTTSKFNRVSFNIRYTYPQQFHYSKNRYYSYRNALYDVPSCMKYYPQYGNMPLRQNCRYNPHDSVTFSRSHRIISATLPHPKDVKRSRKNQTANGSDAYNYNNNNYEHNHTLNDNDTYTAPSDDDRERNGAFHYVHPGDGTKVASLGDTFELDDTKPIIYKVTDLGSTYEADDAKKGDDYSGEEFEDDDESSSSSSSSSSTSSVEEDQILYRRSPRREVESEPDQLSDEEIEKKIKKKKVPTATLR